MTARGLSMRPALASRLRPRLPGALTLVAACLATSVVARAVSADLASAAVIGAAPPETCAHPPDIAALLAALDARAARLSEGEERLADRLQALAVAEVVLEKNLAALIAAEERLARRLAVADEGAEADLARLTQVYEAMKPKVAAELFDQMAPEFAAGFLGRMRAEQAAAILSGMASERAYLVSAVLAGRNARGQTP